MENAGNRDRAALAQERDIFPQERKCPWWYGALFVTFFVVIVCVIATASYHAWQLQQQYDQRRARLNQEHQYELRRAYQQEAALRDYYRRIIADLERKKP